MPIFISFIELLKRIPGVRLQYPANNKDRHHFWERLALELADQPVGVFRKIRARYILCDCIAIKYCESELPVCIVNQL